MKPHDLPEMGAALVFAGFVTAFVVFIVVVLWGLL